MVKIDGCHHCRIIRNKETSVDGREQSNQHIGEIPSAIPNGTIARTAAACYKSKMDMTKQCQTRQPGIWRTIPSNRTCQFRNVSINERVLHPCNTKIAITACIPAGNTLPCVALIPSVREMIRIIAAAHNIKISIIEGISKSRTIEHRTHGRIEPNNTI